jgi:hypothetical protein
MGRTCTTVYQTAVPALPTLALQPCVDLISFALRSIMLTCTFIFGVIATSANMMWSYRMNCLKPGVSILALFWEDLKFVPHISLFFVGIQVCSKRAVAAVVQQQQQCMHVVVPFVLKQLRWFRITATRLQK